jgi:diguanylate cyclase (GGDEF)-like protein/PAS domain S-box-containing protein
VSQLSVLLLEDTPADALRVRAWLGQGDIIAYSIDHATTVADAVDLLRDNTYDVALVDLTLPDSDGIHTFRRIRDAARGTPVVVQSGIEDEVSAIGAMAMGAQDYMIKRTMSGPQVRRSLRYAIERSRIERRLRESEERYKLAVDGANDGIWDWDLRTGALWLAPRWGQILGYEPRELGETPSAWFDLVHPDDLSALAAELNRHTDGLSPAFQHEHRMRHASGGWRWVLSRGLARRDADGTAWRVAGSMRDVTARKDAEGQLMRLALFDELTGLSNRSLFLSRLSHAMRRARRKGAQPFAVLFIDLDRFKVINDSLGHSAGDELLVAVARRLEASVRPGDTVARLGGDEFAVLLEDLEDDQGARAAAERIHEALGVPVTVRGQEVFTSASIGIAEGAGHGTPDELLQHADLAMYAAKREGRARSESFASQLEDEAREELALETELRRALDRDEFIVHYQPVVDLHSGRVEGFEALVRWNSSSRGLVQPASFIPFCEERGLIGRVGLKVLRKACEDAVRMVSVGVPDSFRVMVNLSGRHFLQRELVEQVQAVLTATGCPPQRLGLELTETSLMGGPEGAAEMLAELRALGVHVLLDDFGTGFASLAYLQQFPIDCLKIDAQFIAGLGRDSRDEAIVNAILGLARSLKKSAVAEGVETDDQLRRLRQMGCQTAQGFLFSKAVDFDAALSMLRRGLSLKPIQESLVVTSPGRVAPAAPQSTPGWRRPRRRASARTSVTAPGRAVNSVRETA